MEFTYVYKFDHIDRTVCSHGGMKALCDACLGGLICVHAREIKYCIRCFSYEMPIKGKSKGGKSFWILCDGERRKRIQPDNQ